MFSSEDEQDDNNIFDQLKSIKPFTIDQLYLLHPDVGCPPSLSATQQAERFPDLLHDQDKEVYQNLVEYEQLRHNLSELKSQVKKIYKKTHDHVDKAWVFKEESIRKIAMCQQGKIAETTFKYKQAFVSRKQLDTFAFGFSQLIDTITREYIYYSFESQMNRNKIATKLSIAYQIEDIESRRIRLKSTLTTLIEFIKHLGDTKSDFVLQCRKWFRALAKRLLEENTTENYCFVVSQLARGPVGTADWSSDLIECKPFEQMTTFDSVPQYITHCSALLTALFNSLKHRIERVAASEDATISGDNEGNEDENLVDNRTDANAAAGSVNNTDQNWSLVDPRFSCTEELNIASSCGVLSETDVIKLCLRVPVAQIFRAYVKKCLANSDDDFLIETDKNYEFIMLKLLTIGTIIIKTYQVGLETFNSIQYGSLIEYLSSQIRRTVIILSEKWAEFKNRLKGVDDALLMRLQVEYDSFMLRSILIILELRQSGIWRHLSRIERHDIGDVEETTQGWSTDSIRPAFAKLLQVTGLSGQHNPEQSQVGDEQNQSSLKHRQRSSSSSLTYEFSIEWFKEVSEPMLWHILWQFYHNAFVSSCDYNSDNYWLEKFRENSVIYLFVNKIKDSPPGECNYLLNSITSMLLSRTRPASKLIDFIATEIFNLSYKHKMLKNKITKLGTKALTRCAEKFPNLISLYLSLMDDINYSSPSDLNVDVIDLIKGCSLRGWQCNDEELKLLANWLIEFPFDSPQNKVSRVVLSKILLNSQMANGDIHLVQRTPDKSSRRPSSTTSNSARSTNSMPYSCCLVDLRMRRRLALIIYEASIRHLPENNEFSSQSLGAFVELAFGGLYCEKTATMQDNLIELATDVTSQQFYVWSWLLLFTLRLHILNQPETDWNDLKSRSGTSRSVKNTVLIGDTFHPAPTIQDSECLLLADGLKNHNPMASFIYLMMTDATWQAATFEDSLEHLNVLISSGHITPSMMAMKFFTICHLSELNEQAIENTNCLNYFTTLVSGNFDATSLASLIMSQLDHLKQYRQLQLSQFYVHILLKVSSVITRQNSASWFASNELSLEAIACLLDYLTKFNFNTQRVGIIDKFYYCAYVKQDSSSRQVGTGWLGSFLTSNSINANASKREYLNNLHVLTQKFKKYTWLRWITTECDTIKLAKIWEDIVVYLSGNEEADLDAAISRVCPQANASILKQILPIQSWIRQIFDIMETDLNHPLCPLIWYNFFLHYFANPLNGTSVGYKLVPQETVVKLMSRLDSLFNYHLYKQGNWSSNGPTNQNSLAKLYRAYKLWLQDSSLRDAYVDIDKLKGDYLVPLLKAVMESTNAPDDCLRYIDLQSIGTQNKNLMQVWSTATKLIGNNLNRIICVDNNADDSMEILTSIDDEASDATSLIVKQGNKDSTLNKAQSMDMNAHKESLFNFTEDELSNPLKEEILAQSKYRTFDELLDSIKKNFNSVFEEAKVFNMNISELDRTKSEIIELVKQLYKNKKRELVRVVACSDGNECIGPARIKLEVEEAMMDERKSHCIQDRRRQCQELVGELLLMPKSRSIHSSVIIELSVKSLISDPTRSRHTIENLLGWMSEPCNYKHLRGNYYVANHLLKTCLEILSNSDQMDAYNAALIDVCLAHPESVQIFSPHFSPSACSDECFLQLYKTITSAKQSQMGPTTIFVLLSKFDLAHWLDNLNKQQQNNKQMQHDLIKATCAALKIMGKDPDDSYELAMGLFRRHLQIELAQPDRRRSEEIMLVLSRFLEATSEQQLAPKLWVDLLAIMGFETTRRKQESQSNKARATTSSPARPTGNQSLDGSSVFSLALKTSIGQEFDEDIIERIVEDATRQADCQLIFDYHSLESLINMLTMFMRQQDESSGVTLLELYSDYLNNYATFMLSATFMWIRAVSEHYPDNHEMIWKKFMDLWRDWVFLAKNCQNVGKTSYSLMVNYFVASIRYMIYKIPDNSQAISQSVLTNLASYIAETREVVYLELTILQRSLKNLPWSELLASPSDFENLCALSEQQNYNVSDLVSHIIMNIDIKKSFSNIYQTHGESVIPRVSEKLATTIVLQSTLLRGYRIHGNFLRSISLDQIAPLANLILQRMEFSNLEHNQNNKLLVSLMRFICIKPDVTSLSQQQADENYKRSMFYAEFVSNYLIDLIKRYPIVIKNNRAYLAAVLDNSLQDLEALLVSDLNCIQKTKIYEVIMECCSCDLLELDQRLLLSRLIIESNLLKKRHSVVLDVLHATGQVLRDSRVLVETVEELIVLYLGVRSDKAGSGHEDQTKDYEMICKTFCLKVLPSDIYLTSCIELQSSLALLVYFESLNCDDKLQVQSSQRTEEASQMVNSRLPDSFNVNRIWSSLFHWIAQLIIAIAKNNASSESVLADTKLAIILPRMLQLFESNLQQFLLGEALPTADSFCAVIASDHLQPTNKQTESVEAQSDIETEKQETPEADEIAVNDALEVKTPASKQSKKQQAADISTKLLTHHKSMLEMIKQLIAMYDSLNSSSIWSYLTISARNEISSRLSILALSVAAFLVDRTLATIVPASDQELPDHLLALRNELAKLRRICLLKLVSARKSKNFLDYVLFIETIIECIQRSDKVQYIEGVQSIISYVRRAFYPLATAIADGETKQLANDDADLAMSANEAKISACLEKIFRPL